jgi:putative ABC transport system permease protein
MMELAAEISHGHLKKSVSITALDQNAQLYKIYDNQLERHLAPPQYGVMISRTLADRLEAKSGDIVQVKTIYTGDETYDVPIVGVVNENLGLTAYMNLDDLCAMLGTPRTADTVVIRTDDMASIKSLLLEADNVLATGDIAASQKVYDDMLETYVSLIWFMQIAAMGVAFAIIVNTAQISLSERAREYSTLRVVGMYPREIGRIMAFEYRLLTAAGVVFGIPFTRMLKVSMAGVMSNEIFSLPVKTPVQSFVIAAICCLITVEICNLMAVRNIARFDMVDVLKERE